jgi:histidinol phosphatase-like PHP family hydrolase
MNRRAFVGTLMAAPLGLAQQSDEWINLFDGHSLSGWRPSENKNSWKVVDGMLAADGPRSHLFYAGPLRNADFKNFELEVELLTKPECNSGIYFHTTYQETGFPEKGFEIQVNNTALGDGGYLERKKTGSLYGIRNMYKQLVPDEKPFRIHVAVRGKNVQIQLNGQLLVDYIEPTPPVIPTGGEKQRFLDRGTFALQCHNDGSRAFYRSVRVRPLPDNLPAYTGPAPVVDEDFRRIINIARHNVPMVDYHVYLTDGLPLDAALRKSRKDGLQYGITARSSDLKNDAAAERWLHPLAGKPVFFALAAANGDWTRVLSQKTAKQFDYVLADCRTWKDAQGKLVRLWDAKESQSIKDSQAFMDSLLDQTVKRLDTEPIDIYTHPLYLPSALKPEAASLWTDTRKTKLIDALLRNKVAIEINTLEQMPGQEFIQQAKSAGCKFALGTANSKAADLKRCEYGLSMIEACNLDWKNFYVPGSWGPKAVERKWPANS